MNDFCESCKLSSLIRESTCYKNLQNPSCLDLFLTNSTNSFQHSSAVETSLSDFHRMIVTVMKTSFQWLPPKTRHYRDYSNYDNNSLFNELSNKWDGEIFIPRYLQDGVHFDCVIFQFLVFMCTIYIPFEDVREKQHQYHIV